MSWRCYSTDDVVLMLIYDSFIVPNYSKFHDALMSQSYEINSQKWCNELRHTVNFQM